MEELETKCELLRKENNGKYRENDIYVILASPNAEHSPTPVSKLLITAIDKVRKAAGVLPISISTPNLVLASHMADVPMTSHIFMHWNRPVFSENTTLKFEPIKNVFDDHIKNLNPFVQYHGNLVNLYGPKQEIMDFKFEGHEKDHETIRKCIQSIISTRSLKFSEFQQMIRAVIFSQNCQKCLCYLLNPLDSLKKIQSFAQTLVRGVWSPRSDREMELGFDWKMDSGAKYPLACWRLNDDAEMPKLPKTSKALKNCEENTEISNFKMADSHLKTMEKIIAFLQKSIRKIREMTDFDQMQNSEEEILYLKSLNIGVSRLYMDMRNIKFNIEKFGFSTGNEVLNEELEKVVAKMFEDRKKEFKISRLISQMGPTAYKLLQKSRNRVQVEREIIEKIMEKSLAVFEKTLEKPSEILLTECEEFDGILREPAKTTIVSSSSGSEYDSDEYGLEENECYSKLGDYSNENEALAVAFEHAEVSLIDLETSGLLPLIPSSELDEFCVFCSEFVIDPLPDLSCGMHDTFQQKVNQKVKEIIDQRHSSRKIDKKLVKTLISYAKMWRNECEKSVGTVEISTPDVVRKRPTHKKPTAKRTGFPTFNNDGPRSSSLSSTSSSITTVYDDNPKKKLKKKRSFNASDTSSSSEPCRKRRMTPSRGLLREIEVEKAEERLKIAARALIDTFYPTPISTVFSSRISFWASSYEAQQFDVFENSENFKNFGSSSRERTPKKSTFVLTYKPPSEVQKISSTPPEDDPWNSESVKNSKTISIDDEIQEDDVEFVKDGEKKKKKRSWKVFDESDDDIIIMKNNSAASGIKKSVLSDNFSFSAMEDDESMNDSNAEIPGSSLQMEEEIAKIIPKQTIDDNNDDIVFLGETSSQPDSLINLQEKSKNRTKNSCDVQ